MADVCGGVGTKIGMLSTVKVEKNCDNCAKDAEARIKEDQR